MLATSTPLDAGDVLRIDTMKTSDFSYELPEGLIAQEPSRRRDASRMLLVERGSGGIEHAHSGDLPDILGRDDMLILNDSKVIPARVPARKSSGGKMELLFVEELSERVWEVLMRVSRRPRVGDEFLIGAGAVRARILAEGEMGAATIEIVSGPPVLDLLAEVGSPPLPPYIKRSPADERFSSDEQRYQTVYARRPGAVAAPTAGLHFTPELFDRLAARGIGRSSITLHVGPGTFRPVSSERVEAHRMHSERYEISSATAEAIAACNGRRVAVGSTSVRTLETVAARHGAVVADAGRSDLFIYPPYDFKVVDAMLTNFHLPQSSLLMMVCALAGTELILEAYRIAVAERYRFYSYGDCMLIL